MEKKRKRDPWLFLLPVLVVLLLLFGYPLINSIVMAFQNYKLTAPNDIYFNGFENFKKLFGDPDGLMILKNSIIYVVISVAGQFLLGLTLALALKKQFKGRGLYQSIVFLPWAFSGFVVHPVENDMGMIIRFEPSFAYLETLPIFGFGVSAQPMPLVLVQEDLKRCDAPTPLALLAEFTHVSQCGVRSDE